MKHSTGVGGLRTSEFVPLVALLISLVALSVDAMLPALPAIGQELGVQRPNGSQFVITAVFVGLGVGQLFFGPLSDRIGRKPAIYTGLTIFMIGCLLSQFASTFEVMIAGRVLQGIGAAGPRIVTIALIRDQYSGQQMARILSFVMAVFVLVPGVAPLLGQGILWLAGWRSIFATFFVVAAIAFAWFTFRQPETLSADQRRSLSPSAIGQTIANIVRIRSTIGYTIAISMIFSPFVAYLSSAQQIFQEAYDTGALFPLYFGVLALAVGFGSLTNDRLLLRYGMHQIASSAAIFTSTVSLIALIMFIAFDGLPPLWLFVTYLIAVMVPMGTIFGNLNALAMEPLGQVAGVGAALVTSISSFICVILGTIIGQMFDGAVYFQVGAFALFGLATSGAMRWAIRTT